MLAFMAALGLGPSRPAIPSRVLVEVLAELGTNVGAARRTLSRMVANDLLVREVAGRNTLFRPSERARGLLLAAWQRASAPAPFAQGDGSWTLLAFSMPETRRDVRHQLRARLLWAGLGPLRDGLWIAPGVIDVQDLLAGLPAAAGEDRPWAFVAQPSPPTDLDRLIRRVWDVEAIRAEHHRFLDCWSPPTSQSLSPMAAQTLLTADWLRLLRTDPGLPTTCLGTDWPADRSARAYQSLSAHLKPRALATLEAAVEATGPGAPSRRRQGT